MKYLTLIRHAKSDWSDIGLKDYDRPLNRRGEKAAPMMGQRMATNNILPEILICSPAERARRTARLIADQLDLGEDTIRYQPLLYEAGLETFIELAGQFPSFEHVAVIGHNPGLSSFAEWLCPDAPGWLPTCAVLNMELNVDHWQAIYTHCASILHYDYPKNSA